MDDVATGSRYLDSAYSYLFDPMIAADLDGDGNDEVAFSHNAGETDADGTDDLLIGGYGTAWLWLGSDRLP